MSRFFGRVWKVTIFRPDGSAIEPAALDNGVDLNPLSIDPATAIEITEHRITFGIEKKTEKNPNTCDLMIYNLADQTRALVKQRPLSVKLEVGYDGQLQQLFVGNIQYSDSALKNATWETKLQLKDGGRTFASAQISKSYKAGTPVRTILRDLAGSFGMDLPPQIATAANLNVRIPKSLQLDGYTRDELSRIIDPYGLSWSFQNGLLQILSDDQVREDYAFVIDEENSGMVDTPSYASPAKGKKPKLTFKTLVWPALLPGSKVEMRAREVRGFHKIIDLKHSGDSDEVDWYTTCEAKQL